MPVSDLVRSLLLKRGVVEEHAVAAFLSPDYEAHMHSPMLLQGIERAIDRVHKAIATDEKIAIYADFDCDGIPGAAVLYEFFKKIGYSNVVVYIPHRDKEGYGFHKEAIQKLQCQGVTLTLTVDVGTTAVEAVQYAKELGMDVIVTDHHEIIGELPDAVAILNPKLEPYPFSGLCGAGVAFKFVQALILEGKKQKHPAYELVVDGWEKWLLDLVAIATVADMVPLSGENRVLTYWGLRVLRKSRRPVIVAICNATRMRRATLSEDDIGFTIAPRINAASRMDDPDLAFRLLTTDSMPEAEQLAQNLEELNAKRKTIVAVMVKEARKRLRARYIETDRVVVLGDPSWKPSLLGLAANSIVGDRGGVALLWGRDANGAIKGSARSDGTVSVLGLFEALKEYFEAYGGHTASGGFTAHFEKIHALPGAAAAAFSALEMNNKTALASHEALVSLREVSQSLLAQIGQLAPFGTGNPKPILKVSRSRIVSVRRFGKEKNHTEVTLACPETGAVQRGFQYFKAPEHFSRIPESNLLVDVFATLENDTFRGNTAPVLRLVDIFESN